MSPGFFGFYAHIGALVALEAAGLLEKVGGLAHLYQVPGTDISAYIFCFVLCLWFVFWIKSSSQYSSDFGGLHPGVLVIVIWEQSASRVGRRLDR